MPKVFVDTAAWIALLNISDALHDFAERLMGELLQQKTLLVTTEFVLLEVADVSAPAIRVKTINFINGLRQLRILQIVPISHELFINSWTLYSQRSDKGWGLTDCTSFVVMNEQQITIAFTSDRHFEQAGFVKLM